LSNLVHFAMALVVFLFFRYVITTAFYGWPGLPPVALLWFPVVLIILVALTLGITFFLCAWTTFYEDVKYLVSTGLTLLMYLLPIMYFAENIRYSSRVPANWRSLIYHVYLLNPMAWLVTAFKQMFFAPQTISARGALASFRSAPFDWRYCAITGVVSIILLIAGYVHFNDMKWKFTERP
jgi:ABC-type polysaccharide/polyol phosphate export permease